MKDEESISTQEVHDDIAINCTFLDDCASHVGIKNKVGNSREVPLIRGGEPSDVVLLASDDEVPLSSM